jgi:surface antigen
MVLLGTPALAASWSDGFKTCDGDGSGTISRVEWNNCESKVGNPTMNPTFKMMDKNANNSIDQDEWAVGEKQKMAISNNCQEAEGSWCPCQNNPDDPECQKSN